MMRSDAEILELFVKRDQIGFVMAREKYCDLLYEVANDILCNREGAMEAVDAAFMSAWSSIPPEMPEIFLAYLCKLTRREVFARAAWAKEERADARRYGFALAEFLTSLSSRDKRIFILRYWYLLPPEKIAERSSYSLRSVKRSLAKTEEGFLLRAKKLDHTLTQSDIPLLAVESAAYIFERDIYTARFGKVKSSKKGRRNTKMRRPLRERRALLAVITIILVLTILTSSEFVRNFILTKTVIWSRWFDGEAIVCATVPVKIEVTAISGEIEERRADLALIRKKGESDIYYYLLIRNSAGVIEPFLLDISDYFQIFINKKHPSELILFAVQRMGFNDLDHIWIASFTYRFYETDEPDGIVRISHSYAKEVDDEAIARTWIDENGNPDEGASEEFDAKFANFHDRLLTDEKDNGADYCLLVDTYTHPGYDYVDTFLFDIGIGKNMSDSYSLDHVLKLYYATVDGD